jgi:hypothetical protein
VNTVKKNWKIRIMQSIEKSIPNPQTDRFNRKEYLSLLIMYSLAWGATLLLNRSLFWDDWIFEQYNLQQLRTIYSVRGTPYEFWYWSIGWYSSPVFFRFVTFTCYFIGSLLFGQVLFQFSWNFLTRRNIFLITALTMVLPLNLARASVCTSHYALTYFCFFLGWYLLIVKRNRFYFTLSVIFFVYSFTTSSLLFFYLWPVSHYLFIKCIKSRNADRPLGRKFVLLILPIAVFIIKRLIFEPYGAMSDYNSIRLHYLMAGLFLLALPLTTLLWITTSRFNVRNAKLKMWMPLISGIAILLSGMLPYFAVGYFPPYVSWNTRHEYLQSIGFAIAIIGFSGVLSHNLKWLSKTLIPKLVLMVAVITTLAFSISFYFDSQKQASIVQTISQDPVISSASTVFFVDSTTKSNVFDRPYDSMEWSGMLHAAFSDSSRIGLNYDVSEVKKIFLTSFVNSEMSVFLPQQYTPKKQVVIVYVSYRETRSNLLDNVPYLRYFVVDQPLVQITTISYTDISVILSDLRLGND